MKIATFNINGVNKRLPNLIAWLEVAQPDIICLQELKAEQGAFPQEAIAQAGYDAVWSGQKSWNGVAILSRVGEPVVTRRSLPGDPADVQSDSLIITADVPTMSQILKVSATRPYYPLILDLDPAIIADLTVEMKSAPPGVDVPVAHQVTDNEVADAALRRGGLRSGVIDDSRQAAGCAEPVYRRGSFAADPTPCRLPPPVLNGASGRLQGPRVQSYRGAGRGRPGQARAGSQLRPDPAPPLIHISEPTRPY